MIWNKFLLKFNLLFICYIIESYVLQNSRPGIATEVGKTIHCNNCKKATTAYGVQDTLKNAIMMITMPVTLFCLFANIFAILPVDSIVCYNIIIYLYWYLAIFSRSFLSLLNAKWQFQNLPSYEGVSIQLS